MEGGMNHLPSGVPMQKRITLALTGASGSGFGVAVMRRLAASPEVEQITLLLSPTGRQCLAKESGLAEKDLATLSPKIHCHPETDLGAAISSGSHRQDGG